MNIQNKKDISSLPLVDFASAKQVNQLQIDQLDG
jgi:hypothetical protein